MVYGPVQFVAPFFPDWSLVPNHLHIKVQYATGSSYHIVSSGCPVLSECSVEPE